MISAQEVLFNLQYFVKELEVRAQETSFIKKRNFPLESIELVKFKVLNLYCHFTEP